MTSLGCRPISQLAYWRAAVQPDQKIRLPLGLRRTRPPSHLPSRCSESCALLPLPTWRCWLSPPASSATRSANLRPCYFVESSGAHRPSRNDSFFPRGLRCPVHAVFHEFVDDGGISQGRDIAEGIMLVGGDLAKNAPHDLAGARLGQTRRPLQQVG